MSIGVIGQGFVGGSLTTVLSERGEKVYAFDKAGKTAPGGISTFSGEKRPNSVSQFVSMCEQTDRFSGVFFVCVPTPMYEDGSADISIVDEILQQIHEAPVSTHVSRIAVIKSTVPPGSTANWNKKYSERGLTTVFNPEFLTEANALNDMREQNRIILGGPRPQINRVKQIFQKSFPKIPIIKTGSTTAEMVKYLTNCYLAVKVSFANEVSQICEKLDENGYNIDYDKVVEYAKFDKRLGDTHWAVPGPVPTHDGRYVRGFGGHCFPKDINAMISLSKSLGVNPTVLSAAWEKNLEVRPEEDRDWNLQIGRAVSKKEHK